MNGNQGLSGSNGTSFFFKQETPLEKSVTIGGGSFASLRARASSQEPRKILRQKIQKWARIWYLFRPIQTLLHAGCFHYASQTDRSETSGNSRGKWNDIFRSNRAKRNGSYHFFFLFQTPNISEGK